jgi:extradiol dioxygenase family protein
MHESRGFHLSLVTADLAAQRAFYTEVLGCELARTGADFEDYDFFGNQLTFHQRTEALGLGYQTLHCGVTRWIGCAARSRAPACRLRLLALRAQRNDVRYTHGSRVRYPRDLSS